MSESAHNIDWSFSVVCHGHRIQRLVSNLVAVLKHPANCELIVTRNLPDAEPEIAAIWPGSLRLIDNDIAQGFSSNHNAALRLARGRYLAAIDPDLVLEGDPFEALAQALDDPMSGILSTRVQDENGHVADHARPLPTPWMLLRRYLPGGRHVYAAAFDHEQEVDWVAGLFMTMRADTFQRLLGFDQRFFMYCEDVDLCLRSWNLGLSVKVLPGVAVTHAARRQTLKNARHFFWHCASLIRLWTSVSYHEFLRSRRGGNSPGG